MLVAEATLFKREAELHAGPTKDGWPAIQECRTVTDTDKGREFLNTLTLRCVTYKRHWAL
jgi:hypothetical protein